MSDSRPQVSWKAIEADAALLARDGTEAGRVTRVVGDRDADVFTGLAVRLGTFGEERFLDADLVGAIWPDRVETGLDPADVDSLPPFRDEPVVEWHARKRSLLDRLLGRDP